MKKYLTIALLLVLMGLMLFSCSKEDGSTGDTNLTVTVQSMTGKWYVKDLIKADGSTIPHVNRCTTKRDTVEFFIYRKIKASWISDDCTYINYDGCNDYYVVDRKIMSCDQIFSGTVSKLTATELRIDYDEVEVISNFYPIHTKGIILSKE